MEGRKLKIGFVHYLNTSPFYYLLKEGKVQCSWDIYYDVPQKLNHLLAGNQLDISFVSSVEYLNFNNDYLILPNFSISSVGKVSSVYIYSKYSWYELGGKKIAYSCATATSIALLRVLLDKTKIKAQEFIPLDYKDNWEDSFDAFLIIGDDALVYQKKDLLTYDLGVLWEQHFACPFVYSLILLRKSCVKAFYEEINNFYHYLTKSIKVSILEKNLDFVHFINDKFPHIESPMEYLNNFCYNLNQDCLDSLKLFFSYLNKFPEYRFNGELDFFSVPDIIKQ